jgi:hypothetical protein
MKIRIIHELNNIPCEGCGRDLVSGAEGAKAINSQAKGPYSNGTLERSLCGTQGVTEIFGILWR